MLRLQLQAGSGQNIELVVTETGETTWLRDVAAAKGAPAIAIPNHEYDRLLSRYRLLKRVARPARTKGTTRTYRHVDDAVVQAALRELTENPRITAKEIARRIGVSPSTLTLWRSGRRRRSITKKEP